MSERSAYGFFDFAATNVVLNPQKERYCKVV